MNSFLAKHPYLSAFFAFVTTFLVVLIAGILVGIWLEAKTPCPGNPCMAPELRALALFNISIPVGVLLGGIAAIVVGMFGSIKKP